MNLHTISIMLQQTFIITAFVLGMMMVIEFINVRTGGIWSKKLQKSPWIQIIFGTLLGVIPGCMGTYTMVSLYVHRVINFPALCATMIATSGDEAFFMFSLFPKDAIWISILLVLIALAVGGILQIVMKNKYIGLGKEVAFPIHNDDKQQHYKHSIAENLRHISFVRALLITLSLTVLGLTAGNVINGEHQLNILMGGISEETVIESTEHQHQDNEAETICLHEHAEHHHDHEGEADWIRYTLIALFTAILVIVLVADEHFLNEHLWEHVIKVHFPKIFLWTLGMILAITVINNFIDIQQWISSNRVIVLIIALLIGIIPESGPHLIFVLLFWQGSLPLSILMASSIVQDGHGSLPLLAESRRAFFASKIVGIAAGLLVGVSGIIFGF